jgi:ABC-type glutathione transport system ATPase component
MNALRPTPAPSSTAPGPIAGPATVADSTPLLAIRDLVVTIGGPALLDVDALDVGRGEIVGLVGESGAGKSLLQSTILGILPAHARVSGSVRFDGQELLGASERALRDIRGRRIAVVLQAARAALTPTLRAETWIDRALALHDVTRPERATRLAHALEAVRLDPALLRRYPHELSGGEAQRVSIALAVALRADLILADEATSALDVTVQAEVAELFRELREREGTSFLLVSHDLALVAGLADRISIIAEGRIVERGGPEVLRHPGDPVTAALVRATPALPTAMPLPPEPPSVSGPMTTGGPA